MRVSAASPVSEGADATPVKLYSVAAHPVINRISARASSLAGGAELSIDGGGWSAEEEAAEVLAAGLPCTIVRQTDSRITCRTASFPDLDSTSNGAGGGAPSEASPTLGVWSQGQVAGVALGGTSVGENLAGVLAGDLRLFAGGQGVLQEVWWGVSGPPGGDAFAADTAFDSLEAAGARRNASLEPVFPQEWTDAVEAARESSHGYQLAVQRGQLPPVGPHPNGSAQTPPRDPDHVDTLRSFEATTRALWDEHFPGVSDVEEEEFGLGDSYYQRLTSLFTPPVSGNYSFVLVSDDWSELYIAGCAQPRVLGSDRMDAFNLSAPGRRVAWLRGSLSDHPNSFHRDGSFESAPIELSSGQPCRITALHWESSGVDHLKVGVRLLEGMQGLDENRTADAVQEEGQLHVRSDATLETYIMDYPDPQPEGQQQADLGAAVSAGYAAVEDADGEAPASSSPLSGQALSQD